MSIFKCKMCGGTLEINEGESVAICEYCGTKQTLPRLDDEKRIQLYDRANYFRRENEFDKAMGIYEMILGEQNNDSEAYWGIVLCKYGIEYVKDPRTQKRIPTVNRAQFTSIFDDSDYRLAIQHADSLQKEVYEEEARQIDSIQKGILEISSKEEPFDIFICYKETDDLGNRTDDSVYAQDIYNALKKEGYKVFFSRITLENKLGMAYEPYIFAALHSAKVMLAVGTSKENFNAVWVKNEWSRFLSLIKEDSTKALIPCYKDISPYEMPEEFTYLQSQDIGKIGYLQDIIHGVSKIIGKSTTKTVVVNTASVASIDPLLKRAFMFLEDGEWEKADDFCERVLNQDPECALAYLGKLMAYKKVSKKSDLANQEDVFDNTDEYFKILRFGDKALIDELNGYIDVINKHNEEKRIENIYSFALSKMFEAKTENAYKTAYDSFCNVKGYKNADDLAKECLEKAEYCRKDLIYRDAVFAFNKADVDVDNSSNIPIFVKCTKAFKSISGFKDADAFAEACKKQIETIIEKEEFYRLERQKKAEEARIAREKAAKKRKKIVAIGTTIVAILIVFAIVLNTVIIPKIKYDRAVELINKNDIEGAYLLLKNLDYKDSKEKFSSITPQYKKIKLSKAKVGDIVPFGTYANKDIEWQVLAKEDNKILVISKYVLDSMPYNTEYTNVTWENCTLRNWLNNDFYNSAFSESEKSQIETTNVSADKNPKYRYSTNPGNETTDKVFLLSITEANKYFTSNSERQCKGTEHAKSNGLNVNDNGNSWWWLRSPGYTHYDAAFVSPDGDVREDGCSVSSGFYSVRPAMWISLE